MASIKGGLVHPLPTAPLVSEGCGPWTQRGQARPTLSGSQNCTPIGGRFCAPVDTLEEIQQASLRSRLIGELRERCPRTRPADVRAPASGPALVLHAPSCRAMVDGEDSPGTDGTDVRFASAWVWYGRFRMPKTTMKRWLELLTAVAAVLATSGVLIGGVRWAVDPLREDVQALRAEVRADIGGLRAKMLPISESGWCGSRKQ